MISKKIIESKMFMNFEGFWHMYHSGVITATRIADLAVITEFIQ